MVRFIGFLGRKVFLFLDFGKRVRLGKVRETGILGAGKGRRVVRCVLNVLDWVGI